MHDRAVRYGHAYCVAICDLDDFKQFNDTYGHQAGDDALRKIGEVLKQRESQRRHRLPLRRRRVPRCLAGQPLAEATTAMERIRSAVEALGIPHEASRARRRRDSRAWASPRGNTNSSTRRPRCSPAPTPRLTGPKPRAATASFEAEYSPAPPYPFATCTRRSYDRSIDCTSK